MSDRDAILDAYLTVIGRDGWSATRIDAVAAEGEVSTAAVAAAFADRWQVLHAHGLRLDRAALAEAADGGATVRDRLFTMVMERFDAAQPHRAAAAELASAAIRDPALAGFLLVTTTASVARLADAAGVVVDGLLGPLRVQALTVLVLAVSRTWLDDTSVDLTTTMRTLDERLAQAERVARSLPHGDALSAVAVPRSAAGPPAESAR